MNNSQCGSAKVLFRVLEDDGSVNVETLWASDLGESRYRLANLPFYAYAVSLGDIVSAPFNVDEGFPTFARVISKSGNRTIRVILDMPPESAHRSAELLKHIEALGCSYEGAGKSYIALNVPPGVTLAKVTNLLGTFGVEWEHADPAYRELYPDQA